MPQDDFQTERTTNLAACYAAAATVNQQAQVDWVWWSSCASPYDAL
jgi:hypothetical protein